MGDRVRKAMVPAVEVDEQASDALARLAAEQIREIYGTLIAFGTQGVRSHAGRGHREQLSADVDAAEQDQLPALELRAETHHRMEQMPGQFAAMPLRPAQMAGEPPEVRE